jgi:hypothetical protein
MNDIEIQERIRHYLQLDQTELELEIARCHEGITLHSPEAWLELGRKQVAEAWPKLRELICCHGDLLTKPEFDLAVGIAGLLASQFGGPLAALLAAYVVKRGVTQLCSQKTPP